MAYKTTVPIQGMHCRSCELLIEDELKGLDGVEKVEVSHTKACACIYHQDPHINVHAIKLAVKRAGYEIGLQRKKSWFSTDIDTYLDVFYALISVGVMYLLIRMFGLGSVFAVSSGKPTSLLAVLLIGVTAGLSTCMALVGGLVLGVSARFAEENPEATEFQRFKPHIIFNIGRIVSYTVLGGVIGLLGSVFQLSSTGLGVLTILVAGVMLLLGLQLTNLFPRLEDFKLTVPSGIARFLGVDTKIKGGYSDKGSLIMGATTFFLPCGFTQAMQLYAMSTGNFIAGASIMGAFALGTAPGLLSVGGITSVLKGSSAQKFFKFAGVVVILLALFNFQNGLNLIGIQASLAGINFGTATIKNSVIPPIENVDGKQIIRMTQTSSGYSPNNLTVVKGIPVKWIVTSKDPNSCSASLLASKIGVRAALNEGENVFEFTPTETGKIPFSCMMGMFKGIIDVIDSDSQTGVVSTITQASSQQLSTGNAGSCGGTSGGCGCGGSKNPISADTTKAVVATSEGDIQVIRTTYTNVDDIQPNQFSVSVGKPVRMEIAAKDDGQGCMSAIMIPGYTSPQLLTAGQTITFNFTPKDKGDLRITCAMGVPRGVIKVN